MTIYSPPQSEIDLLQFHIEELDDKGERERFIGIFANPIIALAAFDATVEHWPNKSFVCRHGARVMKNYRPEKSKLA